MTAPLEPALGAAYVHELSADVRAVVVLDPDGLLLTGPEALAAPAARLAALLEAGSVRCAEGVVWVVRTAERTLVAAAGPDAQLGPTALDSAAAIGAPNAPDHVETPSAELKIAAQAVLAAA